MSGAEEYARWVLAPENSKETGRYIKLAAQRFMDDLKREDIYFDEVEAVKMVNFCERYCYQWEGDWRGVLMRFENWQRFIFEQIYGWFRKDDNLRRFEEVFIEISKKNGKSTMCAGEINFHLLADDRINTPKVFTAANNEDQAKICVNMAGRIIEQSEELFELVQEGTVKLFNYKDNITEIVHTEKDGFVKAFAKETSDKTSKTAGGKHGVNASLGVVDEFGMSPDHGASKAIKTSMAARRESLMFKITTSGFNLEAPCYTEDRKVGIDVLEGVVKRDNYLVIIFEIDPPVNADGKVLDITPEWLLKNEWAWKQSNPNIDVSVQRKFLRQALEDAITFGGTTMRDTLTLNFNIWMNAPDVFIPPDVWNKNQHETNPEDLLGAECYGGLEIGTSGQITALALLFPGEVIAVKMLYIMASEAIRSQEIFTKNESLINVDPGNEVDNDIAIDWIAEEFDKYEMRAFTYPKPQTTNSIVQGLLKRGYKGFPLSQGVQGVAAPTDEWEKLIRSGQVDHFGDPILSWMNANCLALRKEQGTRIEKSGKVLGIYACINAVAQWKSPDQPGELGIISI